MCCLCQSSRRLLASPTITIVGPVEARWSCTSCCPDACCSPTITIVGPVEARELTVGTRYRCCTLRRSRSSAPLKHLGGRSSPGRSRAPLRRSRSSAPLKLERTALEHGARVHLSDDHDRRP